MATLNTSIKGRALPPTVDLTAMVDLAFLLITFFMLTTSLAKQGALDVAKPDPIDDGQPRYDYPASQTMTILLTKNHQLVWYMGEATKAKMQHIQASQLRKDLLGNKVAVKKIHKTDGKSLLVIIKPTDQSVYKDLVDVLDEMNINKINSYAIDDKYVLEEEIQYLKGIKFCTQTIEATALKSGRFS